MLFLLSSLPPLVHPLCSGPSSHQASETVPAAKATRHDPLLVAPQDQTPVTMPSLNCTLEGFLWPSWPSLLSLLCRLPFFSPQPSLPTQPVVITSQLQRQSTWGDSQNATHCALPLSWTLNSYLSWHLPYDVLQTPELNPNSLSSSTKPPRSHLTL